MLLILILLAHLGLSFIGGHFLPQWKPSWSRAKVGFVAALPVPLILSGLWAYVLISTATAQCGRDGCDTPLTAAVGMASMIAILYFLGFGLALLAARHAPISVEHQPTEDELKDVFR